EEFLLVERRALEQRLYERIELRAMLAQQAQCLLVAFVDDAKNLGIDEARRLFAERLVAAERPRPQIGVLTPRELHHAELVAHSPTRHHIARELRRLFDIVRCTRRPRAIDNLLCRATAQHPYDARAQVGFRIVVSIRRGTLIRDAQRLPARHDRDSVHGIRARHHETEDRVSALMIGDSLAILATEQQWPLGPEHDLLERIMKV